MPHEFTIKYYEYIHNIINMTFIESVWGTFGIELCLLSAYS